MIKALNIVIISEPDGTCLEREQRIMDPEGHEEMTEDAAAAIAREESVLLKGLGAAKA